MSLYVLKDTCISIFTVTLFSVSCTRFQVNVKSSTRFCRKIQTLVELNDIILNSGFTYIKINYAAQKIIIETIF